MAVLHRKEEKIQAVLGRLSKKYTDEQFVEMFIKLYSKDWGKIKSAYIKQSQDKEPGTVINMPKPEIYLKQVLANYLQQASTPETVEAKKAPIKEKPVAETEKPKANAKKKAEVKVEEDAQAKVTAKKTVKTTEETPAEVKKVKAPVKKKAEVKTEDAPVEKKTKVAAKKSAEKK